MSSAACRWYVLGLTVPLADGKIVAVPAGIEYSFVARSCSRPAMREVRNRLDRAGRLSIVVFSPSWQQAVRDAEDLYRVSVRERVTA